MAEVKNSFIKSKMNKDLDARLIPNGEYREGVNIQVSRSEGADVGALENVLGNDLIVDLSSPNGVYIPNLTTIGMYSDDTSSNIYIFLTDFTETEISTISGNSQRQYNPASLNYYESANNFIWVYNTVSGDARLLVKGPFLNFSTTNPILSVNLLEDLLFWTDNRNQPRRINVSFANDNAANKNPTYYVNEDQISVASYNPFEAIELYYLNQDAYNTNGGQGTTSSVSTGTTPDWTISLSASTLVGIDPSKLIGAAVTWTGQATGVYTVKSYGGNVLVIEGTPDPSLTAGIVLTFNENLSSSVYVTSMLDVNSPTLPNKTDTNPDYNPNYSGDPDYLEDKFVRFSYRFRFEDGEVSIMAPFTQAAFIPKQDGYFLTPDVEGSPEPVGNTTDENAAYRSTIVDFMENKVNQIIMQIPLPVQGKSLSTDYKVSEIEILYKESDAIATKVIDTISSTGPQGFGNMPDPSNPTGDSIPRTTTFVDYSYQGVKPYKTLPKGDLTRVYDKVPVRALGQEVISNRIVYSNFQDKHTPPESLEFNVGIFDKKVFDVGSTGVARNKSIWYTSITEYPMHTVKQNRNYQVGVVLSDRYGRSSTTILSSTQQQGTTLNSAGEVSTYQGGTIYHPYTPAPAGGAATDVQSWPGDSIKVLFNQAIGFSGGGASELPNLQTYWPGLYNGNATSADYNPLGWYSYKIVVKQNEQEYYNVYLPGILNGYPDAPAEPADPANTINFITLFGDNINKVPADLTEVGPDQKQYRSGVQLYGRVTPKSKTVAPVRESPAFNTQFYPGTASDTTIALANQNSMLEATPPKTQYLDIYQTESNPPLGRVTQSDVTNPIGSNPQPSTITTAYNFLLGVYETEPVESVIDIFWETSTSGLISDLNEAINAEGDSIAGITTGNGGTTWIFNLYEDIEPSNSAAVTSSSQSVNSDYSAGVYSSVSFYPYYSSGVGDNPQDTTIAIDSVVDTLGKDRSSDFFIKRTNGSPDSYLIYPTTSFYFGQNAAVDESYVFTLSITDNDPGTNQGQVSTVIAYGSLNNIAPNIENCVSSFNPPDGVELLKTYVTTNGSADVSRDKLDLTYTLTQSSPNPVLTIETDIDGNGALKDPSKQLNGAMVVTVTATDAGGATATCTTAFNGSIGYRTLPLNDDFYTSGTKSINGGPLIINKASESSGFFWTSAPTLGVNDPIPGIPIQAMDRTPVQPGLDLPSTLDITTAGEGTETISINAAFNAPGWKWTNTNRTAAASVAFDQSSTNPRILTLGSNAYDGQLTFGPPIGLTQGTAYILVDFESSIVENINLSDAPGYIWPVYLQYRTIIPATPAVPITIPGAWQDALDIEGQPIVFGRTQVNNNTIANSGSSQFAQTGVISNRDKSEFTVAANTYDKFNAVEGYNYGRQGFGNPTRPVKSVARFLFAFGQCQAYRDQTTFAPVPGAPDKIGDYRLQVRYPNGRNQVLKNGVYVDGGNQVTISSNMAAPQSPYDSYTGGQDSAQVKLQFGDFYNPFQLGYKQNELSYPYRVSRGFNVDIPNAEQAVILSDDIVYAREWAFKYVSRFYIDPVLTIPWEPGETTLPSGAANLRYNGQTVDAYYRYTSAPSSSGATTTNSFDGTDNANVEKDKFTPFGKGVNWTNMDRSWVAKFTKLGVKVKRTSIPLQVLDEGGGGGGVPPVQPTGATLLLPDGVSDGSQNAYINPIGIAGGPVTFTLVFKGDSSANVTKVRNAALAFANTIDTNFNPNGTNIVNQGNVEFYNFNYTNVVDVTFGSFTGGSNITYAERTGGAEVVITACNVNNPVSGGGTNKFWIVPGNI
mgnify:CR=1 FL=1